MPVVINEVIAEVEPTTAPPVDSQPEAGRLALASTEQELEEILALLEERRERLRVD